MVVAPEPKLVLMLPWPPSVNDYWGKSKTSGWYLKKRGKKYKDAVLDIVLRSGRPKVDGPISLRIVAHRPNEIPRDLDNILKAPLDAMERAGVYKNDNLIHHIDIRWAENVMKGGMLYCEFYSMGDGDGN